MSYHPSNKWLSLRYMYYWLKTPYRHRGCTWLQNSYLYQSRLIGMFTLLSVPEMSYLLHSDLRRLTGRVSNMPPLASRLQQSMGWWRWCTVGPMTSLGRIYFYRCRSLLKPTPTHRLYTLGLLCLNSMNSHVNKFEYVILHLKKSSKQSCTRMGFRKYTLGRYESLLILCGWSNCMVQLYVLYCIVLLCIMYVCM